MLLFLIIDKELMMICPYYHLFIPNVKAEMYLSFIIWKKKNNFNLIHMNETLVFAMPCSM